MREKPMNVYVDILGVIDIYRYAHRSQKLTEKIRKAIMKEIINAMMK